MEEDSRYDISSQIGSSSASEKTIGINVNTTAQDKHVPEIERYI